MKKLLFSLSLIVSVFFMSCEEDEDSQNDLLGKLTITYGLDVTAAPAGRVSSIDFDDLVVFILNEDGTEYDRYDRAGDVPSEIELPVGSYQVVAYSDNDLPAAFDNPYYYGETELFSIDFEETTAVTVTASLANVVVTVAYSAAVQTSFDQYTTRVSNSNGDALIFDEVETRAGYFAVDPLTIHATLSYLKADGSTGVKNFSGVIADPQPKTHYTIHIDASLEDGEAAVSIVLDESVTDIDINLSEDELGVCAQIDSFDCLCYQDNDNDGYGSEVMIVSADSDCADVNESLLNTDCDDTDSALYPDAVDIPDDGIDQNCDGVDEVSLNCALFDDGNGNCLCYQDNDYDGYGTSQTVISTDGDCSDAGESLLSNDCDDSNANKFPGNVEVPGDGIDQNCDGQDEPLSCALFDNGSGNCLCYQDTDGDGYGSTTTVISPDASCTGAGESMLNTDCDDLDASVRPGAADQIGEDNNCDGLYLCYRDQDRDGHANGSLTTFVSAPCTAGSGGTLIPGADCNDSNPNVNPSASEILGNGIDDNCDGIIDDFL